MAEMKSIRDRFDPYGGRAIGSREMLDSKEAEYGVRCCTSTKVRTSR